MKEIEQPKYTEKSSVCCLEFSEDQHNMSVCFESLHEREKTAQRTGKFVST